MCPSHIRQPQNALLRTGSWGEKSYWTEDGVSLIKTLLGYIFICKNSVYIKGLKVFLVTLFKKSLIQCNYANKYSNK